MRIVKILAVLFPFLLVSLQAVAQSPTVPDELTLGDLRLKITEPGRKELQTLVDELTVSPTYFDRKVKLAQLYFPIIERILEEENVPEDIKYLVIQESSFVPDAVSVSNAVGYWQFKDFTAAEMKLRVDSKVDERMNIVSSTHAAAKYLKKNNFYFDNWVYAVQAYQMGAGAVMKAVNDDVKGRKSVTINKKTYWYVMKFLAHQIAFSEGIAKAQPISRQLVEYTDGKGKNLEQIAEEFDIDQNELHSFNKWLKRGKIPDDKEYTVVVPAGIDQELILATKVEKSEDDQPITKLDQYENQVDSEMFPIVKEKKLILSSKPEFTTVNGIRGVVAKAGESVAYLASAGAITEFNFRKINEILPHEEAVAGEVYYYKKKKRKAKVHYHTVQINENLWQISQKYGVRMSRLLKKNRVRNEDDVKPGMILWMRYIRPANEEIAYVAIDQQPPLTYSEVEREEVSTLTNPPQEYYPEDKKKVSHIVKQKESYYSIANDYGVEVMEVVAWNKLDINDGLNVGQEINLFVDHDFQVDQVSPNESVMTVENEEINEDQEEEIFENYQVQTGDTLYGIARRYNVTVEDLKIWNAKKTSDVSVGEMLKIKR